MSRRHARNAEMSMSLFPFLDALLCTMGSLILMLVVLSRHAQKKTEEVQEQVRQDAPVADIDQEEIDLRIAQLKEQRDKTQADLAQHQTELGHLEDHAAQLRRELDELVMAARQFDEADDLDGKRHQSLSADLERMNAEIARKRMIVGQMQRNLESQPKSYAIVPYFGPNQTQRPPIYIECTEAGVVLQPEGIVLDPDDLDGPMGPSNPLAAAVRAAREYHVRQRRSSIGETGEPYPLLLVRPDGIENYWLARQALMSWGSDFGYEFVDADSALAYKAPDPSLAAQEEQALATARQQHELLVRMAPRTHARKRVYRATQHGIVEDDSEESAPRPSHRPRRRRPPAGGYASGAPGSGGGTGSGDAGSYGSTRGPDGGLYPDEAPPGSMPGGYPAGVAAGFGNGPGGGFGAGQGPGGTGQGPGGLGPGMGNSAAGAGGPNGGTGPGTGPGGTQLASMPGNGPGLGGPGLGTSGLGNGSGGPSGVSPGSGAGGPYATGPGGPGSTGPGGFNATGPGSGSGDGGPAFPPGGSLAGGPNGQQSPGGPNGALAAPGGTGPPGAEGDGSGTGTGTGSTNTSNTNVGQGSSNNTASSGGSGSAAGNGGAGGSGDGTGNSSDSAKVAGSAGGSATGTSGGGANAPGGSPSGAGGGIAGTPSPSSPGGQPGGAPPGGGQPGSMSGMSPPAGMIPSFNFSDPKQNAAAGQASNRSGSNGSADGTPSSGLKSPLDTFGPSAADQNPSRRKSSNKSTQRASAAGPDYRASPDDSLAEKRGKNWAVNEKRRDASPLTRPVRLRIQGDTIAILADDGSGRQENVVAFEQQTSESVDDVVAAVWKHIERWGIAGNGQYWHPLLDLEVAPNGEQRAQELMRLMADSGLEVRRAAPRAAPAPVAKRRWFGIPR